MIPEISELFKKDYKSLDNSVRIKVDKRMDKIIESPKLGKPLGGNFFSERFDGWRITYKVEEDTVYFTRVERRDKVYERGWG